jgi:hypothetical protein
MENVTIIVHLKKRTLENQDYFKVQEVAYPLDFNVVQVGHALLSVAISSYVESGMDLKEAIIEAKAAAEILPKLRTIIEDE